MKPNPIFLTWTIDDVAACLDLPEFMYMRLWNITYIEFEGVPTLSTIWNKLTKKEKTLLNTEAERFHAS